MAANVIEVPEKGEPENANGEEMTVPSGIEGSGAAAAVELADGDDSWSLALRGVPANRLMRWIGNPFNQGGDAAHSIRKGYSNSVNVAHLDFFVSHSWSAPWWEKVLSLCYIFNYQRASWLAILTAIIEVLIVLYVYYYQSVYDEDNIPTAHLLACISTGVFVIILLLPNVQLARSSYKLFVDNCCIPQDDPVMKEVGIRSLGSCLSRSSSMIVMWSNCYFERLWCVYELAAFMSYKKAVGRRVAAAESQVSSNACGEQFCRIAKGIREFMFGSNWTDKVQFVSLPLLKFVFAFTLVGFFGNVLLSVEVAFVGSFSASLKARFICAIPEGLLLAAVLCPFALRYVQDSDALVNQIKTFEMDNTKCTVESDREYVMQNISDMYDGDLLAFERIVRTDVGREARQALGIRRGTIPFKYVILLSTVYINLAVCFIAPDAIFWGPLWALICFLPQVLLAFTRMPLYIFIILTGARAVEKTSTVGRRIVFFVFVAFWSIFNVCVELVSEAHPLSLIPLCVIHLAVCMALYYPVLPKEKRGAFSRLIDRIFPIDLDVENLSDPTRPRCDDGDVEIGGSEEIKINSLPSMRRSTLTGGFTPTFTIYHAKSW